MVFWTVGLLLALAIVTASVTLLCYFFTKNPGDRNAQFAPPPHAEKFLFGLVGFWAFDVLRINI